MLNVGKKRQKKCLEARVSQRGLSVAPFRLHLGSIETVSGSFSLLLMMLRAAAAAAAAIATAIAGDAAAAAAAIATIVRVLRPPLPLLLLLLPLLVLHCYRSYTVVL